MGMGPGASLAALPEDVLHKIFSMVDLVDLPALSATCRDWRAIIASKVFTTSVSFTMVTGRRKRFRIEPQQFVRWVSAVSHPAQVNTIHLSHPRVDSACLGTLWTGYGGSATQLILDGCASLDGQGFADVLTAQSAPVRAGTPRRRRKAGLLLLSMRDCRGLDAEQLCRVVRAGVLGALTSVVIDRCPAATTAALEALVESCPGLSRLSLQECHALQRVSVMPLVHAKHLTSLDITRCRGLADAMDVLAEVRSLTALRAAHCHRPMDAPGLAVSMSALRRLPGLGELDIRGWPVCEDVDVIMAKTASAGHIRRLLVCGAIQQPLAPLTTVLPRLTVLCLSHARLGRGMGFMRSLVTCCPALQALDLSAASVDSGLELLSELGDLRVLNISGVNTLSRVQLGTAESPMAALGSVNAAQCAALVSLSIHAPNLSDLDLSGTYWPGPTYEFSIPGGPLQLSLEGCRLSDHPRDMSAVQWLLQLRRIRSLRLARASGLHAFTVVNLLGVLTQLKHLDLSAAVEVDTPSLALVLKRCTALESLELSSIKSPAELRPLLESLPPFLSTLRLDRCSIEAGSVRAITQQCAHLSHLSLHRTTGVTKEDMEALVQCETLRHVAIASSDWEFYCPYNIPLTATEDSNDKDDAPPL